MRKVKFSALCMLLCGSVLFSSCIGSFGLFNKVRTWNEGVGGNKWVSELVYLALWIVPVYELTLLADGVVLNTIEFWTGSNPVANAGEVKKVKGENGEYLVKTNQDGYTITNEAGDGLNLKFDEEAQSWNVVTEEQTFELMTMNGEGTVDVNMQNGSYLTVTLDAQGMMAARQVLTNACYAMK